MYRLIQKNSKRLMAVFAVLLMVAFAAQSGPSSRSRGTEVWGTIGGEKVYVADVQQAKDEWRIVSRQLPAPGAAETGRPLAVEELGARACDQIERNPELFLVLQNEARRAGVSIVRDELNGTLENAYKISPDADDDRSRQVRSAVAALMLVRDGFAAAAGAVKVSQPLRTLQKARGLQTIAASVAEFNPAGYPAPAGEADPAALKALFDAYADNPRGRASGDNPFGFGYQIPSRVKFQYVSIPRSVVRDVVRKGRTEPQWEVEAAKFWLKNPARFASTRPAAASQAGTAAATAPAGPRPFAEVKAMAIDAVVGPAVDQKLDAIRNFVVSTMAQDFAAHDQAVKAGGGGGGGSGGGPATSAVTAKSSLGVPYASWDYLEQLSKRSEAQFGVKLGTERVADAWKNEEFLGTTPGIGNATTVSGDVPFASYVAGRADAFAPDDRKGSTDTLALWQPSAPLAEADGTVYVFRLTDAQAAHRPADLAEVAEAVKSDQVTRARYEAAKGDAAKLLDAAKSKGLRAAASAAASAAGTDPGRPVNTLGPVAARGGGDIPGSSATGDARERLRGKLFDLLTTAPPAADRKPLALVELPQDNLVLVAELGDVRSSLPPEYAVFADAQANAVVRRELVTALQAEWFAYDAVVARTHFQLANSSGKPPAPDTPPAANPRPLGM